MNIINNYIQRRAERQQKGFMCAAQSALDGIYFGQVTISIEEGRASGAESDLPICNMTRRQCASLLHRSVANINAIFLSLNPNMEVKNG